jgi:hypothetical protein
MQQEQGPSGTAAQIPHAAAIEDSPAFLNRDGVLRDLVFRSDIHFVFASIGK